MAKGRDKHQGPAAGAAAQAGGASRESAAEQVVSRLVQSVAAGAASNQPQQAFLDLLKQQYLTATVPVKTKVAAEEQRVKKKAAAKRAAAAKKGNQQHADTAAADDEDPDADQFAHWEPIGEPMTREEVLTHYPSRPSIWTEGLTTADRLAAAADKLRQLQQGQAGAEQQQQEGSGKKKAKRAYRRELDAVSLFNFRALRMLDEDAGEEFTVRLGDYVRIPEEVLDEENNPLETLYVARVTEISYTITGEWMVAVLWMYRAQDGKLAHPVKEVKGVTYENKLPVEGEVFPQWRVWLCGSAEDNNRYGYVYPLTQVDRPCRVFHIPPGTEDPQDVVPDFNPDEDFAFWQYQIQDYMTIEDMYEDWTPWSHNYIRVEREEGLEGLRALMGPHEPKDEYRQFARLMQLSRGESKKVLQHGAKRVMSVLELFAGASGTGFLAQSNEAVSLELRWANDMNQSAAATYTANHPDAWMVCAGLEEMIQLCIKWRDWLDIFMPGWQELQELEVLRQLPPGARYSRPHMPQGVGCGGGVDPSHADPATAAADRGERARAAFTAALLAWADGRRPQLPATLLQRLRPEQQQQLKDKVDRLVAAMQQATPEQREQLRQRAEQVRHYTTTKARAAAALPIPDFEAMEAALEGLALQMPNPPAGTAGTAAAGSSKGAASKGGSGKDKGSSESKESEAEGLLSKLLPKRAAPSAAAAAPTAAAATASAGSKKGAAASKAAAAAAGGSKGAEAAAAAAGNKGGAGGNKGAAGAAAGGAKGKAKGKPELSPEEVYAISWQEQLELVQARLEHNTAHDLGEVLEVRDVRIRDSGCARVLQGSSKKQTDRALMDHECWLEFEVLRQGAPKEGWAWEHQALLLCQDAVAPMRCFLLRMLADKTIPLPGDVDVLTGGPPCQNVSGLNRHATQQQVLDDPKNRLVSAYLRIVDHLRPRFLLMEQVTDVFSKEKGTYARYALMRMLQLGYQTRAGILTAGNYGTPQGRRRALFWGALSGAEQLPPFPGSTHRCKNFHRGFPKMSQHAQVGYVPQPGETPKQAEARAFPMVLLGDVFTDLPEVHNFSMTEALQYASKPQTVWQAFLRRNPPPCHLPASLRAVHAQAAMEPWLTLDYSLEEAADVLRDKGEAQEEDAAKVMQAGQRVLCKSTGAGSKKQAASKKQQPAAATDVASKKGSAAAAAAAAAAGTSAGTSSKAAAAAASAAAAAASAGEGSSDGGAGDADDYEEVDRVVERAQAGGQRADDGDDEAAEDAAEAEAIQGEVEMAGKFAHQTLRVHMAEETAAAAKTLKESPDELLGTLQALQAANETQITADIGVKRLKLAQAAGKDHADVNVLLAPLRDHRPHMCNVDDYLRCVAVPGEGDNFRAMPGVITHADGTNCAGSWHCATRIATGKGVGKENTEALKANVEAFKKKSPAEQAALTGRRLFQFLISAVEEVQLAEMPCAGGGMPMAPPAKLYSKNGNDKKNRVDFHGKRGFRGSTLGKCASRAHFLATGDLLCPRWCVTYKHGKSSGRHGCFGRVTRNIIQPTVVTRAEPHNLQVIHYKEDRVLSVRENARCQGFPDFHVFVGLGSNNNNSGGKGLQILAQRYMQIGNAVAPPMSAALGRCLLLAAAEEAPVATPVVEVPDPDYAAVVQRAEAEGWGYYSVIHNVPEDDKKKSEKDAARSSKAAAAAGAAAEGEEEEEEEEEAAAVADADADAVDVAAADQPKRRKTAAKGKGKQPRDSAAAAGGGSGDAAAAAGSKGPKGSAAASKRKQQEPAAAAAAGGAGAEAPGPSAKKARKAGGNPKPAPAEGGRRSSRAAAAGAAEKIKTTLQLDESPSLKRYVQQRRQLEEEQEVFACVAAATAAAAAAPAPAAEAALAAAAAGSGKQKAAGGAAGRKQQGARGAVGAPPAKRRRQAGSSAAGAGEQQQEDEEDSGSAGSAEGAAPSDSLCAAGGDSDGVGDAGSQEGSEAGGSQGGTGPSSSGSGSEGSESDAESGDTIDSSSSDLGAAAGADGDDAAAAADEEEQEGEGEAGAAAAAAAAAALTAAETSEGDEEFESQSEEEEEEESTDEEGERSGSFHSAVTASQEPTA